MYEYPGMTSADAYNFCLNGCLEYINSFAPLGEWFNVTNDSCPSSFPDPVGPDNTTIPELASKGRTCNYFRKFGGDVNISSGNLFDSIDILNVPGIEPNVNLSFHYNSQDFVVGSLGPGWTHTYAMSTTVNADGSVTLKEEDGRRILFQDNGSGNYLPLDRYGRNGTLIQRFTDNTSRMTRKDGTVYEFNSSGLLVGITARSGNALVLGYSGGNLATITDAYNRTVQLGYYAGRLETVTDPAGGTTTIGYDSPGYLRTITDAVSRTTFFEYNGAGMLSSKTTPLNNTTLYEYNQGKVIGATDNATGVAATVDYYPSENKAVYHQRDGGTKTVVYDPTLDLPVQVTQPDNNVISYTYDNTGRVTSISGPGQSYEGTLRDGNITYVTNGLGQTSVYTFNDFDQLTLAQDPEGHTTEYHYNERGILDWVRDASGGTTYFEVTVDPKGKVTAITDPRNRRSTITYDNNGYPETFTDNTGLVTRYDFDPVGNLLSVTDPSLVTTQYTYDGANRLAQIIKNDNSTTQITYEGIRMNLRDANGRTTSIDYTPRNNPRDVTDPLGRVTHYEYTYGACTTCGPSGGDLLYSVTDADGHLLQYRYDSMGRVERVIDALDNATVYGYRAEGTVGTRTDANGHTTTYYYDPPARVTDTVDALQGVTSFDWRPSGFLDNVIDANGNVTHYTYDNTGRVLQTDSPDTGTTTYTYYADGNLHTRTDARGTTATFTYDASSRLIGVLFPDPSENRTYSYDSPASSYGRGRLTGMTDPSGSTTYRYDSAGRLSLEEKTVSGIVYTTGYGYDNVGNGISVAYPSGRVVEYFYNAVNHPEQVRMTKQGTTQVLGSAMVYDNVDNLLSATLGSGMVEGKLYDSLNRFASITAPGVMALSYGYDAAGNVIALTDNVGASSPSAVGTTSYSYLGTRLDNVGFGGVTRTYGYDPSGNTTSDGVMTFEYNQDGRLSRVRQGGAVVGEYVYDGKGRRTMKRVSGVTTVFHYDQFDRLIEETDESGNLLVDYVYLENRPFAQIRAGEQVYYYHTDHLGTPRAMTDANRTVVWKVETDPFGNEIGTPVKTVENNLRFPGQYFDAESGLHYNYFRDYDPKTGRYIQPDPIGVKGLTRHLAMSRILKGKVSGKYPFLSKGGLNLYIYTENNPVNMTDVYGLFLMTIDDRGGRGGATYGGTVTIVGDNGQTVVTPGSSWPNPTNANPGIQEGAYNGTYNPTGHHGTDPAIIVNNNRNVPTIGPNPNHGGDPFADYIHFHCGDTERNRGSAGCPTVEPNRCQDVWNILTPGETGIIVILR